MHKFTPTHLCATTHLVQNSECNIRRDAPTPDKVIERSAQGHAHGRIAVAFERHALALADPIEEDDAFQRTACTRTRTTNTASLDYYHRVLAIHLFLRSWKLALTD